MTSSGRRSFFANNFWAKWAGDVGLVPQCSSRQGASRRLISSRQGYRLVKATDMQYDLLRSHCDLDLAWPEDKFQNWPFKDNKHMDRSGLTRGTRWCQNYSPSFSTSEVIHWQTFPPKRSFSLWWPLVLTVLGWPQIGGHRSIAEIQGYLIILLASIVFEIVAIFCENNYSRNRLFREGFSYRTWEYRPAVTNHGGIPP